VRFMRLIRSTGPQGVSLPLAGRVSPLLRGPGPRLTPSRSRRKRRGPRPHHDTLPLVVGPARHSTARRIRKAWSRRWVELRGAVTRGARCRFCGIKLSIRTVFLKRAGPLVPVVWVARLLYITIAYSKHPPPQPMIANSNLEDDYAGPRSRSLHKLAGCRLTLLIVMVVVGSRCCAVPRWPTLWPSFFCSWESSSSASSSPLSSGRRCWPSGTKPQIPGNTGGFSARAARQKTACSVVSHGEGTLGPGRTFSSGGRVTVFAV